MRSVLLIAGLDPSGGAGLVADVRVVERFGERPVGVTTALTVQDTSGVRAMEPLPAELLGEQLRALLSDVEIAAGKIGMLGSEDVTEAISDALALTRAPLVWDPVHRPSAGTAPLFSGDIARAAEMIADHLALMTPNLDEAAALTGAPVDDLEGAREAARAIRDRYGVPVLVTGGHLPGPPTDVLASLAGVVEIAGERVGAEEPVHGTGCALSTAITCHLAAGRELEEAVRAGVAFVRDRLRAPARPGRGRPSVL